jgi:hypothetical protein
MYVYAFYYTSEKETSAGGGGVNVSEHMGWVRNVVLMSVYFGYGKPQGVGISGRGPDGQVREIQGSVYEQPKEEVDRFCHSKEGSK